jgi:hypothetical protein
MPSLVVVALLQWPRLLASRIERRTLRGLHDVGLEGMMLDAIRSDNKILGMAVAFEPVGLCCLPLMGCTQLHFACENPRVKSLSNHSPV